LVAGREVSVHGKVFSGAKKRSLSASYSTRFALRPRLMPRKFGL
jgi:hypothetical protein